MKAESQKQKILKDIKKITRPNELQEYLRVNVSYEDLLDSDFVTELTSANSGVRRILEGVLIDKEFDEAKEYEQQEDIETIEGIKSYIGRVDINVALAKHRDKVLKLARFYEEEGDYSEAKKYYELIVEGGKNKKERFIQRSGGDAKDTVYYKARIGELACKANMGQDLTDAERDELESTLEKVSSKEQSIDAFLTYFSPISKEQLLQGDFDELMKRGGTRRPGPKPIPNPEPDREYIAELSPDKRLKYLVDNYEISRAYTGLGAFEGSVVLDIPDKNILIVEKFYEPKYEGETVPRPAYGSSTIIVNKDIELDLQEINRGKLIEMGQSGNKLISRVYHRGETYYDRVSKSIEKVSKTTYDKQYDEKETEELDENTAKEEGVEQKEQSITNKEENTRSMDVVLKEMEDLDAAHDNLQAMLTKARKEQQKVETLRRQVIQIRSEVNAAISGKMTSEMSALVSKQIKLLNELKQELSELEKTTQTINMQECELEIAKNREKRERLNDEIRKMC